MPGIIISINWLRESPTCLINLKLEGYSERAMKIILVAWVAHKAGMQCSICSSRISTVPCSMKNSMTCFQLSPDVQQSITTPCTLLEKWEFTTVSQCDKNAICCPQLHCIEFNVPGTNFSIKQLRGKNALLQNRTRSNLTQSVFATTEAVVVCLRRLQGVDS